MTTAIDMLAIDREPDILYVISDWLLVAAECADEIAEIREMAGDADQDKLDLLAARENHARARVEELTRRLAIMRIMSRGTP